MTLNQSINKAAKIVKDAQRVYGAGNGGSAATVNHFIADLQNTCGIDAESFCQTEKITALGNDYGYETIFERQLIYKRPILEKDKGKYDAVIMASFSGASRNIYELTWMIAHSKRNIRLILLTSFASKHSITETAARVMRKFGLTIDGVIIYSLGNIRAVEDEHLRICHQIISKIKKGYN